MSANITRRKGQTAELSCNVTANPKPEITWFRNGKKVERNEIAQKDCKQLTSGFYKIKGEEMEKYGPWQSRLVVCSATHLQHTGRYACKANNSMGNDTAIAYLNILGRLRMQRPH